MHWKEGAVILDAHSDIPHHLLLRPGHYHLLKEEHLPLLLAGGVDLVIANLFTRPKPQHPLRDALLSLQEFMAQVNSLKGVQMITCRKDLMVSLAEKQVGFLLSMEGLEPLGSSPELLGVFYQLGVRLASLTWNHQNNFASGAMEEGALTSQGEEVLHKMQELGILLDLSHLNTESFWGALKVYPGPVLASHSNAHGVYPHPRNLTDDQLQAVADRGGVVGLNNYMTGEVSTLDTFMEHLLYLVQLLGEDHVGLGLDFNGYLGYTRTPGMEDPTCIPVIWERMKQEGFSLKSRKKIIGGNFLELLQENLPE